MAELIQDLAKVGDLNHLISDLHHRFDDLRVKLKEDETWIIATLVEDFAETLDEIADIQESLLPKCEDLKDKLDFLYEQYAQDRANVGDGPRVQGEDSHGGAKGIPHK